MRTSVAVVADDLTGAADTGAGFVAAGLATIVTWTVPGAAAAAFDAVDAIAVDLQTRIADASRAERTTGDSVRALRAAGVPALFKKCDSLLRGHVAGEVAAAIASWHPGSIAVAAFAFPDAGRTTMNGHQCVNGGPIGHAPIASMFEQRAIRTRGISLEQVRSGGLAAHFLDSLDRGIQAVVCDAETTADLEAIARSAATLGPRVVWVGSGGLARALPGNVLPHVASIGGSRRLVRRAGGILIVVGSATSLARAQAEAVATDGAMHVSIDVGDLLVESACGPSEARSRRASASGGGPPRALSSACGPSEARSRRASASGGGPPRALSNAATRIADYLRAEVDVVVTLESTAETFDNHRLVQRLGELLRPHGVHAGGLVVTGGDTATSVLRAWRTTSLRIVEEIEAGVPLSMSVGPLPMPVVTKAGAFGNTQTLVRARARVRSLRRDKEGAR